MTDDEANERFKRKLGERPNRKADCNRQSIYYRCRKRDLKYGTAIASTEERIRLLHQYWEKYGQFMTAKPADQIKCYLVYRFTLDITDPQELVRVRKLLIAETEYSYEYFIAYVNKYHRVRRVPNKTAVPTTRRRRTYRSTTAKSPGPSAAPVPSSSSKPIEFVQFITPVYFSNGHGYTSLKSFLQASQ